MDSSPARAATERVRAGGTPTCAWTCGRAVGSWKDKKNGPWHCFCTPVHPRPPAVRQKDLGEGALGLGFAEILMVMVNKKKIHPPTPFLGKRPQRPKPKGPGRPWGQKKPLAHGRTVEGAVIGGWCVPFRLCAAAMLALFFCYSTAILHPRRSFGFSLTTLVPRRLYGEKRAGAFRPTTRRHPRLGLAVRCGDLTL